MENKDNLLFYRGVSYEVRLCSECTLENWICFKEKHKTNPKGEISGLLARIQKLAMTGRLLTPNQLNSEGDGFFAVKSNHGLRCYFWYSGKKIVISHFKYKKSEKLDEVDKDKMKANRKSWRDI